MVRGGKGGLPHRFYQTYGLDGCLDVVHTQDVCPLHQGDGVQDGRSVESVGRCPAQQLIYHGLPRDAYQQGQVKRTHELLQVCHQLVVVLQRLAEAEAGVEDEVVHPHVVQTVDAFGKIDEHLTHQAVVVGGVLHGLRRTLHVHHDVGHLQAGDRVEHPLVHGSGSNVVDDADSIVADAAFCHIRPEGVDRNDGIGALLTHDAQSAVQPFHLLLCRDVCGIRTG